MKNNKKWLWAALAGVGIALGLATGMAYIQGQGSRPASPRIAA